MKLSELALVLLVAGCAFGPPPREGELGNPRNPVRADTFLGEFEYLSRGFTSAGPPDRRRLFWFAP
jgi:hypothetical protein